MICKTLFINHILKYLLSWLKIIPCPIICLFTKFNMLILFSYSVKKWMFYSLKYWYLRHLQQKFFFRDQIEAFELINQIIMEIYVGIIFPIFVWFF